MKQNPFINPIKQTGEKIKNLEFHGGHLLPSIIVAIVLFLTITVLVILIPYGYVYVIESFHLVKKSVLHIRENIYKYQGYLVARIARALLPISDHASPFFFCRRAMS